MPGTLTDLFAWGVVALFLLAAVVEWVGRSRGGRRELARRLAAAAWVGFGGFWLVLFPHFAFTQKSYVEGVLSAVAVPACVYVGYLLWQGRDSLFVLSRAVAVMGLVYLPFETIPAITLLGLDLPAPRRVLIEVVAAQTGAAMGWLGYHPELLRGPEGYWSTYQFVTDGGHQLRFTVLLACTGLGSMAIFVGLAAAVRAPLRRKLTAVAIAVPIIWALNIVRTTFIGIAFGKQYLHVFPDVVLLLFGASDPYKVSFFLSDRVISQVLAVVALIGVTYLVVRRLPELLTVIEDVLYVVTNEEYDLRRELDLPRDPATEPPGRGSADD
ncbi:archaeosortase A [Halobaculum sp. MBLA0147]|uniref:archaeosortase A n=1 Tax=Halobaculum sp. MBLA0147 TaxID=3079934 RepID=UPI00352328A0